MLEAALTADVDHAIVVSSQADEARVGLVEVGGLGSGSLLNVSLTFPLQRIRKKSSAVR